MTFVRGSFIIELMRTKVIYLILALFLSACGPKLNVATTASPNAKRYPFKGMVTAVNRGAKKATIEHDAVPGYMEAMTMDFPIHADWVWGDLKPGAEIRAELVVDNSSNDPYFLENIGIVASVDPNKQVDINPNFAQIGQPVPDFSLTNQDGKNISLKDFRGKALAITFIYAKCPLPDYCIRMSTNFSDLANQLARNNELKKKVRLLSISFDPANDTPAKLRSYGLGYLSKNANANFDIWTLAVGKDAEVRKIADFFGLRYEVDETDKTLINHSLRTAVIDPDGKVTKIFAGNDWVVADLKAELERALGRH